MNITVEMWSHIVEKMASFGLGILWGEKNTKDKKNSKFLPFLGPN